MVWVSSPRGQASGTSSIRCSDTPPPCAKENRSTAPAFPSQHNLLIQYYISTPASGKPSATSKLLQALNLLKCNPSRTTATNHPVPLQNPPSTTPKTKASRLLSLPLPRTSTPSLNSFLDSWSKLRSLYSYTGFSSALLDTPAQGASFQNSALSRLLSGKIRPL